MITKLKHMKTVLESIDHFRIIWGTEDTKMLLEAYLETMKEECNSNPPKGILRSTENK